MVNPNIVKLQKKGLKIRVETFDAPQVYMY